MAEKRQKILTIVLIGTVITTVLVLIFGFNRQTTSVLFFPFEQQLPESLIKEMEGIKNITLDLSIFESDKFKSLKSYGSTPVIGERGRPNPFLPF